ncbi:hypothetical protein M3P21_21065 [Ruegeria sp. 2012CJ41-6]|uniref:Uncharacterized protein n=1 Tax=Ruegeria spongiae TaxID=2942209 RepID=A0ABT0Q829_9RHOB|nr:hypothetical protein [Ruegeria spongiae]MCL6286010.1 hypothetical protein [Ruegeria spongiae]
MTWETRVKAVAVFVSVVAILVGGWQYLQTQKINAARPYLEKKLEWCEEAVRITSKLAVMREENFRSEAEFWQLYWGVMGLTENADVTRAMVAYGKELNEKTEGASEPDFDPTSALGLTGLSLDLAHACRGELANEWSPHWRN